MSWSVPGYRRGHRRPCVRLRPSSDNEIRDLGTLGGNAERRRRGERGCRGRLLGQRPGTPARHAFVYDLSSDTEMRDLGTLGGTQSFALR